MSTLPSVEKPLHEDLSIIAGKANTFLTSWEIMGTVTDVTSTIPKDHNQHQTEVLGYND